MLCNAAERSDVGEVERLIAAGANPNAFEGTDNEPPLQRAAVLGNMPVIAALLKAGAHVNGARSDGTTPVMRAAFNGFAAAIDALIAAGADAQRANNSGFTALHWASRYGYLDAVRVLLEAGAKTDVRDGVGKRPIDRVCDRLHLHRMFDRVTMLPTFRAGL